MVDADGRQIDLHPLRSDAEGNGWHQLSEDASSWGRYDTEHLQATGSVGGRVVCCLSAELQVRFHQDYELSDVDRHDLDLLAALLNGLTAEPRLGPQRRQCTSERGGGRNIKASATSELRGLRAKRD
jgi:hypothetical protein